MEMRSSDEILGGAGVDTPGPATADQFKGADFPQRLGYATAGIAVAWRRERSLRAQSALAAAGIAVTAALATDLIWAAVVALAIGLVLALEMMNAALEYLVDHLHPEVAEEIKFAKDAAAGAVLIGSITSVAVGALMVLRCLLP